MPGVDFALEARGVTKRFGERLALQSVDLAVPEGAHVCLFGPNGAGKTTLLRVLATLVRPTQGKVFVQGIDASENPEQARARIGVVSHSAYLYPDLKAQENLLFFAKLYGIPNAEARVHELLKEVDLHSRRYDAVRTFSRGMTQRLSIARSLINDPSVLLLDEPYSGLDPFAADALDSILHRERQNRTIVMVSHDIEKGFSLCSHALVMAKGKIVLSKERSQIEEAAFEEQYRSIVGQGAVR